MLPGTASRNEMAWRSSLLAAVAAVVVPSVASAQLLYTGAELSENFDGLTASGSFANYFSGTNGVQRAIPALPAWRGAKLPIGATTGMTFAADNGNSADAGMYSYGSTGSADRALGALANGYYTATFGVEIVNNFSTELRSFTLDFFAEQWRSAGDANARVNSLAFAYGISGGALTSDTFLCASGMIAFPSLDAPGQDITTTSVPTDGNDPAYRTQVHATVENLSVPVGARLFIRWTDTNNLGKDAGIAIDDFTFTATGAPKNLTWNGGSTTWDTNSNNTNWLAGATPSAFSSNDIVSFTDTGVGVVEIAGGGVTPAQTTVANTIGTYVFNGGGINGSGALTKDGAGSLALNNANNHAGGTIINDGTLVIGNDNNLGASGGSVTMNGGVLALAGNVSSNRTIAANSTIGTATIDTAGFNGEFAAITGAGNFDKAGAGSLTVLETYGVTGTTRISGGNLVLALSSGAQDIVAESGGGGFVGNLVVISGTRLNINSGVVSGGGQIRSESTGFTLSTNSSVSGVTTQIDNNIQLNSNDVVGPFAAQIGCTASNTMIINGQISGNADVHFAADDSGGGDSGITVLNNHNTYTGTTYLNSGTNGVVKLGVDDAIPIGSRLVFGSSGSANLDVGALDLNGHAQTVAGLAVQTTGTVNGIANTAAGAATLIFNTAGGADDVYSGPIGVPANAENLAGANNNISIVKIGAGSLALTGANTYTGKTVVQAGQLMLGLNAHAPVLSNPGDGADIQAGLLVLDYAGDDTVAPQVLAILDVGNDLPTPFSSGKIHTTNTPDPAKTIGWSDDGVSQVTIAYTYKGDSNLDGQVTISDLGDLASNWQSTAASWAFGDFNYDGSVTISDLGDLASNWQAGVGSPLGVSFEQALAAVGLGGVTVPEPAGVLVIGFGVVALRRRRR